MFDYKKALDESGVYLDVDKIPDYVREYIAQATYELVMRVRAEKRRKEAEANGTVK